MKALVEDRYFCTTGSSFIKQRITKIKVENEKIIIPEPNELHLLHPSYKKVKRKIYGDYNNSIILQIIKE